ncbi:MAG: M28 family peptidase [Armatimonadota bacterium]
MRLLATLCVLMSLGASCGGGGGTPAPPAEPIAPMPPPTQRPAFDAERAFTDLEAQVAFGPRVPGSTAHEQCEQFLRDGLSDAGARVVAHQFTSATALSDEQFDFTNLLGVFAEDADGEVLLLGAHWDSRAVADRDPDPDLRDDPVPAANDGASGVALLLEIARAFAQTPPPRPVVIAFFDAEDQGSSSSQLPHDGWILGSQRLVDDWPDGVPWPDEMILVDMVAGDNEHNDRVGTPQLSNDHFDLPIEANSLERAPDLVDRIWTIAERLGHSAFERTTGYRVVDDHIPFLDAGVPAVDIIEFVPPEWHTVDDTPEHCAPESLDQVGETLLEFIYGE